MGFFKGYGCSMGGFQEWFKRVFGCRGCFWDSSLKWFEGVIWIGEKGMSFGRGLRGLFWACIRGGVKFG